MYPPAIEGVENVATKQTPHCGDVEYCGETLDTHLRLQIRAGAVHHCLERNQNLPNSVNHLQSVCIERKWRPARQQIQWSGPFVERNYP